MPEVDMLVLSVCAAGDNKKWPKVIQVRTSLRLFWIRSESCECLNTTTKPKISVAWFGPGSRKRFVIRAMEA